MKRWQVVTSVAVLGLWFTSPAWAAQKPGAGKSGGGDVKVDRAVLAQQLKSGDPVQIEKALESIRAEIQGRPKMAAGNLKQVWVPALLAVKRAEDAANTCADLILAMPDDLNSVEMAQQSRLRALQAAEKHEEALAQAKALFNVCTMKGTGDAILLLQECLRAARPQEPDLAEKFRQEQVEGAAATPPSPESKAERSETPSSATQGPESKIGSGPKTQGSGLRSSVLDSVKIDGKAYDEALGKLTASDYRTLAARGNLLLLADRIAEAKTAFDEAYAVSSDKDLAAASENIARCMRASDGTIGRANAWVVSIRPKEETAIPATPEKK